MCDGRFPLCAKDLRVQVHQAARYRCSHCQTFWCLHCDSLQVVIKRTIFMVMGDEPQLSAGVSRSHIGCHEPWGTERWKVISWNCVYWFRRKSSSSGIHHTYYCCILLNPFVLSFTDHLVLPGPFRGSPQRLLYLHLTLSLGSFSVIPTLCMSSSSALMNLRGFTLFLKPSSSIFKIPLFNISTIPVALTWAVPLTSWFPWLSALK